MAKRKRLGPANPDFMGTAPMETKSMAPIAQVAGDAAGAAALEELAGTLKAARDEGRMVLEIPLGEIAPEHLARDRVVIDQEDLEALKASIRTHGQRTPAEVTPIDGPHPYGLISGWRRFQALSELHGETGDPKFATLKVLLRKPENSAEAYVAMVEENEIRVGLSYYERARVAAEAVKRGVFEDEGEAIRALFASASRAKRSKIRSFIEIYEQLGDALQFPTHIPERLGLAVVEHLRTHGPEEMVAFLNRETWEHPETEILILTRLSALKKKPPAKKPKDVSRAKHAIPKLRPGVRLDAERSDGQILVTLKGKGVDDALMADVLELLSQLRRG